MSDFVNLSANGTKQIKKNACRLQAVIVGTAGTDNTLTIYDSPDDTGRVVATIDTSVGEVYSFGADLDLGMFVSLAGGTAANVTIVTG